MSVTITPTNGSDFTWAASTWAWNDPKSDVTWATAHPVTYDVAVGEAIATSDSLSKDIAQAIAEAVTVADGLGNDFSIYLDEQITMVSDIFSYMIGHEHLINWAESVAISDEEAKAVTKNIDEVMTVAETFDRIATFYRNIAESLGLMDAGGTLKSLSPNESFNIAETLSNSITKNVSESITLSELLSKNVSIGFAETFTIVDAEGKTFTTNIHEVLSVVETYVRKANAVFSNMIIGTTDLTKIDFDDVVDNGRVPGYDKFRDFIPGDYTYQKALFRAILNSATNDRARLNQMKVTVDVPDIFDRGTVTITTGDMLTGVTVTFNRQFHITPEITLTLKAGTGVSVPVIVSANNTQFVAILKDPATGLGVVGTFTWSAHGY